MLECGITNKTIAGWKIHKGSKASKDAGKRWDVGKSFFGTAGETVRANAKTGKGVVSPNNGKGRTERMTSAHQHGKARAARKAGANVAYKALTKLLTLICGRSQTGNSTAHNQKKKSISAC